ncbi:MAG: SipW-dependent-type signal peptide-containing protein [Clostridia bacterium]|nr:SipW-dependent-type signal peptide-containing protein [Clostridia bacterium]
MNRKRIGLAALVIACLALVAAGTSAYFTAQETAYNVITTGNLKLVLHDETTVEDAQEYAGEGEEPAAPETEEGGEEAETTPGEATGAYADLEPKCKEDNRVPFPEDGLFGLMPGEKVEKYVYLQNIGNVPFYARVKLTGTVAAADKSDLAFDPYIILTLDEENWTKSGDWYYYNAAVESGEYTTDLLTLVTFSGSIPNEYMDCKVSIKVDAQAVQSKNNGDDPLTAAGWPSEN